MRHLHLEMRYEQRKNWKGGTMEPIEWAIAILLGVATFAGGLAIGTIWRITPDDAVHLIRLLGF